MLLAERVAEDHPEDLLAQDAATAARNDYNEAASAKP
jgi:hypothetical protein